MQNILNFISAILGIIGSLMIFLFGVPKKIDTEGKISLCLEQEDDEEKRRITKYKKLGNIGIWLITFSFIFQLFSNPIATNIYHYLRKYI